MTRRRILYVQHASTLGGSCVSLRYLIENLDRTRFEPVVAFIHPSRELEAFYASTGAELIAWPGILTFEHTALLWTHPLRPGTWPNLAASLLRWRRSERRTVELVRTVRPDVTHLNSAVLFASARALHRIRAPFVWHVREGAATGIAGVRFGLLRRAMSEWPDQLVFLTEAERQQWTRGGRGRVVRNVVDLEHVDSDRDGGAVRDELGIPRDAKVILYVGGLSEVKGVLTLLDALPLIRSAEPRALIVMPGAVPSPGASQGGVGGRAFASRLRARLDAAGDACVRTSFADDIGKFLAAADVLAFPALSNHFARPIIEAGAMRKPVVASRFPITEEQVWHGASGLLVPPGEPRALAAAVVEVLADPARAREMGRVGRELARAHHDPRRNTGMIMEMYDAVVREHGERGSTDR